MSKEQDGYIHEKLTECAYSLQEKALISALHWPNEKGFVPTISCTSRTKCPSTKSWHLLTFVYVSCAIKKGESLFCFVVLWDRRWNWIQKMIAEEVKSTRMGRGIWSSKASGSSNSTGFVNDSLLPTTCLWSHMSLSLNLSKLCLGKTKKPL